MNPYDMPDRPLEPHEIDQVEAALKADDNDERGLKRIIYWHLNRTLVRELRKGEVPVAAEAQALATVSFWSGLMTGVVAGAFAVAFLVLALSWTWSMRDAFGFVGSLFSWTIIVVMTSRLIYRWWRFHHGKDS